MSIPWILWQALLTFSILISMESSLFLCQSGWSLTTCLRQHSEMKIALRLEIQCSAADTFLRDRIDAVKQKCAISCWSFSVPYCFRFTDPRSWPELAKSNVKFSWQKTASWKISKQSYKVIQYLLNLRILAKFCGNLYSRSDQTDSRYSWQKVSEIGHSILQIRVNFR